MMRALILLMLSCCLVSTVFTQSSWSAGVNIQAGFTGQTQTDAFNNEFNGTRFTTAREGELIPAMGAGGWVQFQLHRSLGLRFGANYLNSGNREYRTEYTELLTTGERATNRAYNYELRIHQLNIPLEVVYEPGQGKLRPHFSIGVQASNDWHGTINEQIKTAGSPNVDRTWTRDDRTISRPQRWLYQPVASIGLRFNDQITLRVRHTWAPHQDVIWTENNSGISNPYTDGIYFCGLTTTSHTRSNHKRLTSLQFSYRIF